MLELFTQPESWIAVATLTLLEVVLGVDNIVFIAILTDRVEAAKRSMARKLGLAMAMVTRLLLLLTLSWLIRLETPLFSLAGFGFSGKSLILLGGGMFLITKATREIYIKTELKEEEYEVKSKAGAFWSVIFQIALLDIIFSLDSIITAVGLVNEIPLMVIAIVAAVIVMIAAANPLCEFVNRHASIKILALAFLLLIGVLLVGEGMGRHFEKGYVYFAMAFSLFVQVLNLRHEKNIGKASTSS